MINKIYLLDSYTIFNTIQTYCTFLKNFCTQCDKETNLADETQYVWDPEQYNEMFFKTPIDISTGAIQSISEHLKKS